MPIVAATAVPDMAPTALSTLAMTSACAGESTRVETTVAMELGASVQPFTNSAASTSSRTGIRPSGRWSSTGKGAARYIRLARMAASTSATSSAWSVARSRVS